MKKSGRGGEMSKPKKTSATKTQQKLTSAPKGSATVLTQPHFDMSKISSVGGASTSGSSSKGDQRKKVTVSSDDLDYAHNIYLLALATMKLQEKALSEVTAENEKQRLALLSEVESKRSHLAALTKRYEDVKYLHEQNELLRRKKEMLGPLVDLVSDGLKSVDTLKNALDCGLPVKGFQAEESACSLKNTLHESNKMLDKMCAATCEHEDLYSETSQEIAKIQSTVMNIAETQNRCDTVSAALNHAVLKECSLKVVKQRNMK